MLTWRLQTERRSKRRRSGAAALVLRPERATLQRITEGPALYCRFCRSRSLGPRWQEMGKAMRLAVTLHGPFTPKNVFRGI